MLIIYDVMHLIPIQPAEDEVNPLSGSKRSLFTLN